MTSLFQSSLPQHFGLLNNDARVLPAVSPSRHSKPSQAAAGLTETHDACLQQKFNSLTLDELSAELDSRTKETQRLQEEVEHATKLALQKFGHTCSIHSSTEESCNNRSLHFYGSPEDSSIIQTQQHVVTQPRVYDLDSNQMGAQKDNNSPEEEVFENIIDGCLQQLSDLHLRETHAQRQQETLTTDEAFMNLQTELHKVQMEKDVLSDLRLKDSKTHVVQMEKMLCMLEELQNIKKAGDQKLQESEEETLALNRKVDSLERDLKEMCYAVLSQEKHCGGNVITSAKFTMPGSRHSAHLTKDLKEDKPHEPFLEQHGSEESSGVINQKERFEDLIACVCQEMALLTDKLYSSKNNSINLSAKLELLKKLAESQVSLHQRQLTELQSTLVSYKDRVCCLDKQLSEAQSQLVDAQREREQSVRQTEELQSQLHQLKRCDEKQQCELQEEVKVLRGQLESAKMELCRDEEERTCLEALLEQRAQEGRKSQELLEEKTKELYLRQQNAKQLYGRLEEAEQQCQVLQAEGETLRLQLDDQERMMGVLRLQMESSIQMAVQHSHTIDNLHQENSLISNQLKQQKQEVQQLRAELKQRKSELAAAEQEKQQLQASVAEQSQRVQEETMKKQQATSQLEVQRVKFLTLTEKHQQLQHLHICKSKEQGGVVLKLQSQLKNTHNELDQVKSSLKTLEGADGHGLQVAMEMQKKITARREQIDSLQGKIQHLEETMEKLHQEKRQQSLQHQHQLQELSLIREERRQLRCELETLCSKDKQLRDRISQLEALLHKMSESFADCQDFIQQQEQEFFRLKLKHALDLKELQGQNLTAIPDLDFPSSSALPAPPFSQHASSAHITKQQKESSVKEFRSLAKELQGVISENHRPHTENNASRSSIFRRRSAPEREHRTIFKAEEIKATSRLRRKTYSSESHVLRMAELNGKEINSKTYLKSGAVLCPATTGRYISSPQLLSLGRKSPVHSLLTSDPNSHQ